MSILTENAMAQKRGAVWRARIAAWLNHHPKLRHWLWFATLWFGGLFAAFSLAMVVKLMVRGLQQM